MNYRGREVTPRRVFDAVYSRLTYHFVRPVFGMMPRLLYGNDAGLMGNVVGRRELERCRKAYVAHDVVPIDRDATIFRQNGYVKLSSTYPDALVSRLKARYHELITSDTHSEFNGVGVYLRASRALRNPLRDMPDVTELLTPAIQRTLVAYYGAHFRVDSVRAWRTTHVDGLETQHDAYSNQWHNDHFSIGLIRLFVYLSDGVTRDTGALRLHSMGSTQEIMRKGYIRRSTVVGPARQLLNDPTRVVYFEGNAGAACLANVELCLHRAGIPRPGYNRDIVQINFAPSPRPFDGVWGSA